MKLTPKNVLGVEAVRSLRKLRTELVDQVKTIDRTLAAFGPLDPPPDSPGGEQAGQHQQEYFRLLLRFREHCDRHGKTFTEGMRGALAAALGEPVTFPPKGGRGRQPKPIKEDPRL